MKQRTKRESKDERRRLRQRIGLVAGVVVFSLVAVVARAYFLQVVKHNYYLARQQSQCNSSRLVRYKRGEILASDGKVLAASIKGESLYAEPRRVQDKRRLAKGLAPILKMKVSSLERGLRGERGFAWLKRSLTPGQVEALQPWCKKEPGLAFSKEARRIYPNRDLAGQVLGFTNIDCQGQEGLELYYDEYLQGRQLYVSMERDARRQVVESSQSAELDHLKGKTVYLTIDRRLQAWAEQELETAVTGSRGKGGVALVMDADNGAVLAMAQYPRFNPNSKRKNNPALWRNRAVTDLLEPGSTLKAFTLVAALESGIFKIDDLVDCEEGKFKVGNRTIHDTHEYGLLRLDEVLKYSSNIGCSKIAERIGAERFYAVLKNFGFGSHSGIDYPHEPSGRLRPWQKWREIDLCNHSFGQGVSMTSVQLVAAYAALANGGHRVTPHLVAKIINGAGWTVYEPPAKKSSRVCSSKVAQQVDRALALVVEDDGTAPQARIPGFRVMGKTGTAQKFDFAKKSYSHKNYRASFVGYVDPPKGQSRKIVYVMVDEPRSSIYGGLVAAPAFQRINRHLLSYLNYASQTELATLTIPDYEEEEAGCSVAENGSERVENFTGNATQAANVMPDFTGRTIRDALILIGSYRRSVKISGQGRIVSQKPQPGTTLEPGLDFVFHLSSESSEI
ncbi:MAG: transpeptidase family protein [Deltaproteobacteria bacterium]|nr:transpeptidase family protein [Candidatus Tharpella aukensis]